MFKVYFKTSIMVIGQYGEFRNSEREIYNVWWSSAINKNSCFNGKWNSVVRACPIYDYRLHLKCAAQLRKVLAISNSL